MFSKKPLSKEELIERLKAIASDETPRVKKEGAMCYSPMPSVYNCFVCTLCGGDISYMAHDGDSRVRIKKLVRKIAGLGYDVKVEAVCKTCAGKLKKELYPDMKPEEGKGILAELKDYIWLSDINHVFYFRTSADSEYHRAIANYTSQYMVLLTFLQNEPMYLDEYDASHYVVDEIETLEFMTGIKFGV